jgi:hypothetical protein
MSPRAYLAQASLGGATDGSHEKHEEPKPAWHATVNRLFWEMQAFGKWRIRRHYALVNPWKAVETLPEDELPIPDIDPATWAKFLLPSQSSPSVARGPAGCVRF